MRTISDETFTGLDVGQHDETVSEIHNKGIILCNGTELSYVNLADIMRELKGNLLLPKGADNTSYRHLHETLQEACRLFNVIHFAAK